MKILALGDPHGKLPKDLDGIIKKNGIDLIVCIGDVPPVPKDFRKGKINYFRQEFLRKADRLLEEITKKLCSYGKPVITLRGNMYLTGSRNELTKRIFASHANLYYKKTGKFRIKGIIFVTFDMSFEPHMYGKADSWMKMQYKQNKGRGLRLMKLLRRLENPIIISHAPPFGYLDKTKFGHRGSKILLRAIRKYQPKLVLCGHIHEQKGKKKIGKTEVYNLGHSGDYKIIEAK